MRGRTVYGGHHNMSAKYGDKTDYPKIDVFVNGDYAYSTTWCRTCKEAVQRFGVPFSGEPWQLTGKVTARRAS